MFSELETAEIQRAEMTESKVWVKISQHILTEYFAISEQLKILISANFMYFRNVISVALKLATVRSGIGFSLLFFHLLPIPCRTRPNSLH